MSLLVRNPNIYYGGALKRRRRVVRRRGAGLGDWLSKAHNWIKSNKIISTVGKAIGSTGLPFAGIANTIGNTAEKLGYGVCRRRKRVVRRKKGGAINLRDLLSSAHKFIKDKKLVSSALSHFGYNKLSAGTQALGYGRRRVGRPKRTVKRRVVRRVARRGRGGANFFSTEQIAAPKF